MYDLENVCDCHWAMFKFTMKSVIRDFETFIVENFLLCYVQTHKVEVVCWIKYNIILNLIIELKKNGDSFFNCCEKHFQLIMFPCHITIMSLEIILFIYSQNLYCTFTPLMAMLRTFCDLRTFHLSQLCLIMILGYGLLKDV